MTPPEIRTARLTLRAIAMADWEAYAAMWADPRVTRFIGGAPRPRDLAWTKFTQSAGLWPLLGYGYWSVIDGATGDYLGLGGFARFERAIDALEGYPECGWAFTAGTWGRGIGSEAVGAMVAWADDAGLGETRCMINDGNDASVKVATRNGYCEFATLPDARVFTRPGRALA